MQLTAKDPTAQLIDELDEVIANFKKRMAEQPMPCAS